MMSTTSKDYVPENDAQFSVWADSFVATVETNEAGYGLTTDDVAELKALEADWDGKFAELISTRDAAKSATVEKDESRSAYETKIRQLAQKIQNDPAVSEGLKVDAGLPAYSKTRTPVPVPTTSPIAEIDASQIREHFIRFTDSASPNARIRPRGVMGVEVSVAVGNTAPTEDDQFNVYAMSTRMSTKVAFTADQAGQTAWYRFRYINTRGEFGPFSMVYNATVLK